LDIEPAKAFYVFISG